ncbi:MAG: hypothetical protein AUJ92_07425 [Armatimonadetes bacterium CG2_30_59_28]|nr:type II toxin-antitoxin system RelE/ParE family toxin [Armatimonadota bacterium]OIO95792.1 MAG: hypothetical protein AUJ92_07425 [Armatimonadetes bacterium CG2_30_59_28]PIU67215.1 MAG: hypothetical protein COS85_01610 [Armatimonadetes bacterium CG07_land_8_20_14_0_80_59_28]PIX38279.1 MAG: hypothetical protein COZ56_20800 [Armatimonadetes bacterium CG_4_8_14_3_um_filter_58_9]PIY43984.1 MAG: hypothetical protein COZ05_09525 [Armatimonadetes bacterium CG_4_10_14_3_um_filter_59_10]PJB75375.1 MA
MAWEVVYRPQFIRDLARMPESPRKEVEQFAFDVFPAADNPFAVPGLEKMSGFKDYYKARFGVFRVGIRVVRKNRVVEFQRVLNRRDIYRHFPSAG